MLVLFSAIVGLILFCDKEIETEQDKEQTASSKGHPLLGKTDAIVEFGNYKCPSCKQ